MFSLTVSNWTYLYTDLTLASIRQDQESIKFLKKRGKVSLSRMHRQRKRDLNLKPNRVLDKRSSRGMIYENEELRMRTLAIAEDVDRGHNDIKKLRKENEHLKREIWALRDECEKLEEILKKVVSSGAVDLSELPYPELFLDTYDLDYEGSSIGGSSRKTSFDCMDEDFGLMHTMFATDSDTGSVIEVDPGQEDQSNAEIVELHPQPHSTQSTKFSPDPDLGPLKEEETSSPETTELPDPSDFDLDEGEVKGTPEVEEAVPLIQITPAVNANVQDGGCLTLVPKSYEVTSQLQIDSDNERSKVKMNTPKLRKLSTLKINHRHSLHDSACADSNSNPPSNCYQSEPSLFQRDVDPMTPKGSSHRQEEHYVVGLYKGQGHLLSSQEVIDKIESDFDPSLETIKGIRILGHGQSKDHPLYLFLCLKDAGAVAGFLNKYSLETGPGLTLPGENRTLEFDQSVQKISELLLSGLGPEVSDELVVASLNQWGQVLGTVERRGYKGIEIWERGVKMHLVKEIEAKVKIGGYDVSISFPKAGEIDSEIKRDMKSLDQSQTNVNNDNSTPLKNQNHHQLKIIMNATEQNQIQTQSQEASSSSSEIQTNGHKPIARCASSNPRLESPPVPASPVPAQRQPSASLCAASIPPEQHPARLFTKNPKTANANSSSNLQPPIPGAKKPLMRLLKSSPLPVNDPRRGSTASQALATENNNNPVTPKDYLRRNSNSNPFFQSRFNASVYSARSQATAAGHRPLGQNNSNSSSGFDHKSNRSGFSLGGKSEPLPWCGCWGNGCI